MPEKDRRRLKHWYFITYRECQLCGRTDITRCRIYGQKPRDPDKRRDYKQVACPQHFYNPVTENEGDNQCHQ